MAAGKSIEFQISAGAYISGALALLILPLRWILAAVLAAAIHEGFHCLALRLCGVRIYGLTVGAKGAVITTEPMDRWQELLCALAGPAGSMMLLLFFRQAPLLAICGLIQGFFNLLPVLPFDGGRAVESAMGMFCPKYRESVMAGLRCITIAVIGTVGIGAVIRLKLGLGALLVMLLLIQRLLGIKIPCKEARKKVQ